MEEGDLVVGKIAQGRETDHYGVGWGLGVCRRWPSCSLALIPLPDKRYDNAVGLRKIGAMLGPWAAESVLMTACLVLSVADKTHRYTLPTFNQPQSCITESFPTLLPPIAHPFQA